MRCRVKLDIGQIAKGCGMKEFHLCESKRFEYE